MTTVLPRRARPVSRPAPVPVVPAGPAFAEVARTRRVDLVSPVGCQLDDDFAGADGGYRLLARRDAEVGSVEAGGGAVRLAGRHDTLLVAEGATTLAPYAAVSVDVVAFSGDPTRDRVQAGLVRDADAALLGWYDHAAGCAGVDLVHQGVTTTLAARPADLTRPVRLTFALAATTVVVFAQHLTGEEPGPRVLVRATLPEAGAPDLRDPAVLRAYRHAFGAASGSGSGSASGTTVLGGVRSGYFGQLGLRDPHLVTEADGTPYLRDGKAYLTFTGAGPGFFETAHWGVWTLDLETYALEQVALLFTERDGRVMGDHAGHLVLDRWRRRWIVATSTWGDFDGERVDVGHGTVARRVDLTAGVHVVPTETLRLPTADLPSASVGRWDPHVVRIAGRWYVGFVNARRFFDFYPVLARSPRGGDYTELDLVGADPTKVETEGIVLQRFGGDWRVLASNGDASPAEIRGQYPVYDLAMRQLGVLDAPHPTNIPWPSVIGVPARRGRTRWLMVTFDGTPYDAPALGYGTHGDTLVLTAPPTRSRDS